MVLSPRAAGRVPWLALDQELAVVGGRDHARKGTHGRGEQASHARGFVLVPFQRAARAIHAVPELPAG